MEAKELKLTGETTAQEIEEYIHKIISPFIFPDKKLKAVFTIGEYGAILLHRCISNYAKSQEFFISKFESTRAELVESEEYQEQYIIYSLPNGDEIKIIIEDPIEMGEIDEITGFPVKSTVLKFIEII